ncbi:MAG: hypothetical protein U9R16_03820 [Campylobacterota bacterium]|nr:hypothetical protein [Campylobacterota bacterium]
MDRITSIKSSDYSHYHNSLTNKVSDMIISYLVPQKILYSVDIEDELDIQMSNKDEDIFENTIEVLEKRDTPYILQSLIKLDTKYPNSYTLKYNIGLYYEKNGDNLNALEYYEKAASIKITESILDRIDQVKINSYNIEKIKFEN